MEESGQGFAEGHEDVNRIAKILFTKGVPQQDGRKPTHMLLMLHEAHELRRGFSNHAVEIDDQTGEMD